MLVGLLSGTHDFPSVLGAAITILPPHGILHEAKWWLSTEDAMVGWHHQLEGHEFEQAPEVGDGQGSLVCCSPWGSKESDNLATEQQQKIDL